MSIPASFLGLEGLSVFVTGAAGVIGSHAVREFLDQGCRVTAHDVRPIDSTSFESDSNRLHIVCGDIADEVSIQSCMASAVRKFGPINILVANAWIPDEQDDRPLWEMPLDLWERSYRTNVRGTFLTIKHFLLATLPAQGDSGKALENLAIIVTGSDLTASKKGNVGYAAAKAHDLYGMIEKVKHDILKLNSKSRINVVEPGWVDTSPIEGSLDRLKGSDAESQATGPAKGTATPEDVTKAMAFLASHHAASHISGQCLVVDGDMKGRLVWKNNEIVLFGSNTERDSISTVSQVSNTGIPAAISLNSKPKIRVALSVDLDAVSGWLGTGTHPDNVLADYSAGFFAARVGVPRLLKLFKKLQLADRCTWFIPGHSAESFKEEVMEVVQTGCEIAVHGYAHEGAYQLTVEQEREVLEKCIEVSTSLTGRRPVGYRAPLYQVRESTLDLLEEYGFEYDASLTDQDCHPFFAPCRPPLKAIDFGQSASSWMHPIPKTTGARNDRRPLVEVPCNWYMEDMTPMQFLPHAPNSHGYVDVRVIEQLWKDRFLWLLENEQDPIFPLIMHPDTSGMAHVIGMIERIIKWFKSWGQDVEFCQTREIAKRFRSENF
ncbi:hypothetical protein AJ79_08404 [Helicocarpus griseus UAMH5409]|uniref:NodB homology domain-containing protein n=1 Tax=Helicocarpus griseus UAMH5409 TaxID=1447875 RepID=A0A2B7WTC5_9EURO|nr:hypothetical protein AJ79_08404 [Helicocarpus griseus UAMH5409]